MSFLEAQGQEDGMVGRDTHAYPEHSLETLLVTLLIAGTE